MSGSRFGYRRGRRVVGLVVTAVLLGAVCVGAVPAASAEEGGPSPADFCSTWDAIAAAHANGESDVQVTLSNGTVISASEATLVGSSCNDVGAGIEMTGAGLADAEAGGSGQGGSSGQATTPPSLVQGEQFLTNLWIDSLRLSWTPTAGITLSGTLHLGFTGGLVNLRFSGSYLNPDNWSLTLSSPPAGTWLPVIQSTPFMFSGTLGVSGGAPLFGASASAAHIQLGSVSLDNFLFDAHLVGPTATVQITADLTASNFTAGVDLVFGNSGGTPVFDVTATLGVSTNPPSTLLVAGSLDPAGNLALLGQGDVALGGYGMTGFTVDVSGSPSSGVQVFVGGNLAFSNQGISVNLGGSLSGDSAGNVAFNLTGSADFKFGYLNIKSGRFTLAGTDDAAQASVRFSWIAFGFLPVNAVAYFNGDGSYKRVHVPFGVLGYLLFGGTAKSACRCQVSY